MKRSLVMFMVIGLIFGSIATAEAGKKRKPKKVERTVELAYQTPSPGMSGVFGACMAVLGVDGTACIDVPISGSEAFVSVSVTDATGQPTNFDLAQDSDSAQPGFEIFASGCGETSEAIPVTPGLPVRVSVSALGGPDCPGAATTGSVSATFSNLP